MHTLEQTVEPDWFDEFVAKMNPKLFSYFARYFQGDTERAKDLTQILWHKFVRDERFGAQVREESISEEQLNHQERWLWKVADNLRRDEYQKDQVREQAQPHLRDIAPNKSENPEDAYERKESDDCVRESLQKMENSTHRKVIELFVAGYKYHEIADITGLAVSSLGTTLLRSKEALKQILCDICPEVALDWGGGNINPGYGGATA